MTKAIENTVKRHDKHEIGERDNLDQKGPIEENDLNFHIQLAQSLKGNVQVREEKVEDLENVVNGQAKHEIEDERNSSGKSMVERIGQSENDIHALAQRLDEATKVWKMQVVNLEMALKRNEEVERFFEVFKCELDLRERLDKVVTRFQNRLPVFVGFLGVLYTITFPCEMREIFTFLNALSCMGIILVGGLATFHFWVISIELMILKDRYKNFNTNKKGGSQSQANTHLPLSGESPTREATRDNNVGRVLSDMENGENYHQFFTFRWYAGPYVIDIIVMFIFALAFVLIFGAFIYAEKCVTDPVSPTPTPTPVSSDDMLFPIA